MNWNWWRVLVFITVIVVLVGGIVFGSIFLAYGYIPKQVAVKQEIVVREEAKETSKEAITSKAEKTTVETTTIEEKTTETVAEGEIPPFYESEGGIPYNGNEWNVDVAPDESEVFTGGPAEVLGVKLEGGSNPDRGSVIILLPFGDKVINYTIKNVIAGSNWHGAIDYGRAPTEKDWKILVDDRVKAMMEAPNGTSGKGCQIVDVVVVQGDKIIFQETYER